MCVSGHRRETSIRSYASRLNDRKKRQIFETLSKSTVLLPTNEDTDTVYRHQREPLSVLQSSDQDVLVSDHQQNVHTNFELVDWSTFFQDTDPCPVRFTPQFNNCSGISVNINFGHQKKE